MITFLPIIFIPPNLYVCRHKIWRIRNIIQPNNAHNFLLEENVYNFIAFKREKVYLFDRFWGGEVEVVVFFCFSIKLCHLNSGKNEESLCTFPCVPAGICFREGSGKDVSLV